MTHEEEFVEAVERLVASYYGYHIGVSHSDNAPPNRRLVDEAKANLLRVVKKEMEDGV